MVLMDDAMTDGSAGQGLAPEIWALRMEHGP